MSSEPRKLSTNGYGHEINGQGLRARRPSHKEPVRFCDDCNPKPYPESANEPKEESEKKTFGRTPGGKVFTVPQTHDMVSQLLSPTQPKNLSDLIVLTILALLILTLYVLPSSIRIPTFAVIFLFWRGCYNVGIGYLLRIQSHDRLLVKWAYKSKIFRDPTTGENPHPQLYKIIKRELETKIPEDYSFEGAPIEYNTWLVFRRVVDLILMCDFVSYCLFAVACGNHPVREGTLLAIARWLAGWGLVGFNLWVKLDAHRVVKDYAWYWGDFFYLIDQELTFDGVFEMAPHPMYSVGYAGYYGISLLAASYKVLAISIIAHAAQFAFLILVENPHIEKTYNQPPPRKRSGKSQEDASSVEPPTGQAAPTDVMWDVAVATPSVPSQVHNLLGLRNIDLFRITDTSVILLQVYMFLLTALTPSTPFYQALFVLNAIAWRLWYSVGLGFILTRQSNEKAWTRHFVKFGESADEAWRQWKGMYHLSMTMCHVAFIAASWKMYLFPSDWNYGLVLLKHIVGAMLIALQIWTAFSIYDSLSEFGWFFGDFFFDQAPKLTYSGIYRYLNNPERVLGLAGIWGAVLITRSTVIFCLALMSHILALSFIQFVERPHMQKLYGRNMRREAGLVKSIKRSLPPPLKNWHGNVDKVLEGTVEFVEDFIESARPRLAAGVEVFVKDASALFSQYPARISLTRVAPDLAGYDPKDYSLEIEGTPLPPSAACDYANGKEGAYTRYFVERRSDFKTKVFEYGTPIRVKWTSPLNHSKKDWIGLYKVVDNASRQVTKISSAGRWVATTPGEYDSSSADDGILVSDVRVSSIKRGDGEDKDHMRGEMMFRGDKLWWTQGVFEFRYHHDGKHNVMAISLPFEIRIGRFDEDDVELDANGSLKGTVEQALLPVVRNCFDEDPDIAPNTVDEEFGPLAGRDAKYAKRIVFAVQHMFGIEFAPGVVKADRSVRNLAWRICNSKKVLAPYSMSLAKGTTTPTHSKY